MTYLFPISIRRFALLLLALVFSGFAQATPPVNDSFANRIQVFNSNSYSGSNVGATLESGEPIPAGYTSANYQGTIWYFFNPAAQDWYEVNTINSSINTVLAVWTGSALGDLQLVHVNNEAVEGKVSRIRFQGSHGTLYFISVAGHDANARGAVTLTVQSGGNQMINGLGAISSVAISPPSVDVTSAPASATFTINMAVTADIAAGYVRAYAPNGQQVASSSLSIANLTSGNNLSGTYAVPLTLPRFLTPGTYMLGFEVENAGPSKTDSYGWDQMSSLGGFTQSFTVLNSGPTDSFSPYVYNAGLTGTAAAQTADPDGDGIRNLEEFAFGTDPSVNNHSPFVLTGSTLTQTGLPKIFITGTGSQKRLRVEYLQRTADLAHGLTYQVEFSNDLIHWSPAGNAPQVMGSSATYQAVFVEDQLFLNGITHRFGHVKISYSPQ